MRRSVWLQNSASVRGDDDQYCAVLGCDAVQPGKLVTDVSEERTDTYTHTHHSTSCSRRQQFPPKRYTDCAKQKSRQLPDELTGQQSDTAMTTALPAFFGVNEENLSPDTQPPQTKQVLVFREATSVPKDHCFVEGSQASPICPSGKSNTYRGPDKSLARPTSRCILFDGENISFDASLVVIYINRTNIPPIMIVNRIYETQNLLSL